MFRFTRRFGLRLVALAAAASLTAPSLAQDCNELLRHGIFDVRGAKDDRIFASFYAQWFCSQSFKSQDDAQSYGGSFEQPFRKFSAQFSRDNWSTETSQFCQSLTKQQYLESHVTEYSRNVSPTLMNSFDRCVGQQGLHAWFKLTEDPHVVVLLANYVPDATGVAIITAWSPGKDFNCSPTPMRWNGGKGFANQVMSSRCTRHDGPVTITLQANHTVRGGDHLTLPALPRPAPPVCPSEEEKRCEGTKSAWRGSTFTECPGISVSLSPENSANGTVSWMKIQTDTEADCRRQMHYGDACEFLLQGKKWKAILGAVDGNGQGANVTLRRVCR